MQLANRRAAFSAAARPAAAPRAPLRVMAQSAPAPSASVPVKSLDGAGAGAVSMSLKVAGESAKGLVHRYLVYVMQNARRVRILGGSSGGEGEWGGGVSSACGCDLRGVLTPEVALAMKLPVLNKLFEFLFPDRRRFRIPPLCAVKRVGAGFRINIDE